MAANPQTKPIDLACDSAHRLLPSTFTIATIIVIIIIIFFNDKLTIVTHYKIKDKYNINNVGLTTESSNTYN